MLGVALKEISLSQGKVAIVDESDFEWLSQFKWSLTVNPDGKRKKAHKEYAMRYEKIGKGARQVKRRKLYMHREIMRPGQGLVVDHLDGNGVNNSRSNLAVKTQRQNLQNGVNPEPVEWE